MRTAFRGAPCLHIHASITALIRVAGLYNEAMAHESLPSKLNQGDSLRLEQVHCHSE